jgi:hypothetical protein
MPIYKYVSPDTGLKYLESWKLRCSLPRDLNDPFEISLRVRVPGLGGGPKGAVSPQVQAIQSLMADTVAGVQDMQDALARMTVEGIGILCFTRSPGNLLMWAHYAGSHAGLLLEFDETQPCFNRRIDTHARAAICGTLGKVVYSARRPSITTLDTEGLRLSAYTKSLEWGYEEEVRLLWPTRLADAYADESGKVALLEVPASALRSVTFGCYCGDDTRNRAEALLEQNAPHVQQLDAVPHRDEFRIDRVRCD